LVSAHPAENPAVSLDGPNLSRYRMLRFILPMQRPNLQLCNPLHIDSLTRP